MKFTEAERTSAAWVRLEKYLKDELDILRIRNDGDADQLGTAKLRGRIYEIKKILSFATPDERVAEQ